MTVSFGLGLDLDSNLFELGLDSDSNLFGLGLDSDSNLFGLGLVLDSTQVDLTTALALTYKNVYLNQYKAYSTQSIQWLEYIKASKNVDVHYVLNHDEFKFGPYYVDGYYELNGDRIAL